MTPTQKSRAERLAEEYCAKMKIGRCSECGYFPMRKIEDAFKAGWAKRGELDAAEIAELKANIEALTGNEPEEYLTPYENELLADIKLTQAKLTAAEERAEKVINAAMSVFALEHINRTTYSPAALANYNKAMAELGEALKDWEDGK